MKISRAAELVKRTRLQMGISQGKLCRKLGYSTPQYLSNFERGLCYFPNKKLKKAAVILKLPKDAMAWAVLTDFMNSWEKEWGQK